MWLNSICSPHRCTGVTYVNAALLLPTEYKRVVCRSLCRSITVVSRTKTAGPIEMPFGLRTRENVLDGGPDLSMGRGIVTEKGRPVYSDTVIICAETAEPIEMPFGL